MFRLDPTLLRRCLVTSVLIGLSVLVALYSRAGGDFESLLPLLISEYLSPVLPEVKNGELWRLVTPIFVHFGLMHIVFNSIMMFQFGSIIEPRLGGLNFLVIVLLIAVSSNVGQYLYAGPAFGGLSGVVYGLFGYFWMSSRYNPRFGARINPSAVKILLGWFVLCWFNFFGLLGDQALIANVAHTVGLVVGMLLALFAARTYLFGEKRNGSVVQRKRF